MTDQSPTIRMIPLDQLVLHPFNPRQTVSEPDIDALAQSIALTGLINNLAGYDDGSETIGIVAGGRRLRALQKLAALGWTDCAPIDPVPVQVTSDGLTARAWAGAENATQAALHPSDEIRLYSDQAAHGVPASVIARAFGKTERYVASRLKLAALSPDVLSMLAGGEIGISTAEALCLSEDPAQQLTMAQEAARHDWSAAQLRSRIKGAAIAVSDRRVRFVGLPDYEARGGRVTRDLFTEDAYVEDETLLDKLFAEMLADRTDRVKDEEGWSWAEFVLTPHMHYDKIDKLTKLYREQEALSDDDAAEYDRLSAIPEEDWSEDERRRFEAFEEWMEGTFSDEQKDQGGVFCRVDHDGEFQVSRAYAKAQPKATKGSDDTVTVSGGEVKPALPQNATEDLRRIRQHALQAAAMQKPKMMLDLLAWQIEAGLTGWRGPLGVALTAEAIDPEKPGSFHRDERLPDFGTDFDAICTWAAFEAFLAKGEAHRNQVLARAIARTIRTPMSGPFIGELAQQLEAAALIRRYWTPDSESYFKRLREDRLTTIWKELSGQEGDELEAFAAMKKADRAAELEKLFSDAGFQEALGLSRDQVKAIDTWLPPEMDA